MKIWNSETYKNNHIRLKRFHWGLCGFYIFLLVATIILLRKHGIVLDLIFLIMFVVHMALAIGSGKKLETSRKLSEIIGAIMLLAFPVGTLLGYFLLQRTMWAEPIDTEYEP